MGKVSVEMTDIRQSLETTLLYHDYNKYKLQRDPKTGNIIKVERGFFGRIMAWIKTWGKDDEAKQKLCADTILKVSNAFHLEKKGLEEDFKKELENTWSQSHLFVKNDLLNSTIESIIKNYFTANFSDVDPGSNLPLHSDKEIEALAEVLMGLGSEPLPDEQGENENGSSLPDLTGVTAFKEQITETPEQKRNREHQEKLDILAICESFMSQADINGLKTAALRDQTQPLINALNSWLDKYAPELQQAISKWTMNHHLSFAQCIADSQCSDKISQNNEWVYNIPSFNKLKEHFSTKRSHGEWSNFQQQYALARARQYQASLIPEQQQMWENIIKEWKKGESDLIKCAEKYGCSIKPQSPCFNFFADTSINTNYSNTNYARVVLTNYALKAVNNIPGTAVDQAQKKNTPGKGSRVPDVGQLLAQREKIFRKGKEEEGEPENNTTPPNSPIVAEGNPPPALPRNDGSTSSSDASDGGGKNGTSDYGPPPPLPPRPGEEGEPEQGNPANADILIDMPLPPSSFSSSPGDDSLILDDKDIPRDLPPPLPSRDDERGKPESNVSSEGGNDLPEDFSDTEFDEGHPPPPPTESENNTQPPTRPQSAYRSFDKRKGKGNENKRNSSRF